MKEEVSTINHIYYITHDLIDINLGTDLTQISHMGGADINRLKP